MTIDHYISLGLMGLLIFQQVYTTITINRLVDKVMSKNYGDYVMANRHEEKTKNGYVVQTETEPMQDLNELMGMGPQI